MFLKEYLQWRVLVSLAVYIFGEKALSCQCQIDRAFSTHWTTCALMDSDNKLRTLPLISYQLCQKECGLRKHCVAVNYWPRAKVCDLLSGISGMASNVLYGKPCVHVAAPMANIDKCDCSRNDVCNPESGNCEVQECPAPHVSNATLLGNMYAVGSKVKVVCASGYDVKLPMVCEHTGNWSNYVECGCPEPCPALSYATLQPGGAHAGAIRKYKCRSRYSTSEGAMQFSVTCLADRKWSTPTTNCGKAIDSDVGPTDYVTVGCQILKISNYTTNHSDAKSACAPFGNLVRIDSAEKQAAIRNHLQKNASMYRPFWIQGTFDVEDRQWKFDDGSRMVYTNWPATQSHVEKRAEYCLRMTKSYYWDGTRCERVQRDLMFICELLEQ